MVLPLLLPLLPSCEVNNFHMLCCSDGSQVFDGHSSEEAIEEDGRHRSQFQRQHLLQNLHFLQNGVCATHWDLPTLAVCVYHMHHLYHM